MVQISSLQKTYGTTRATNIDRLELPDGQLIGLVGNNGAGKSTLFRLMLDLTRPDNGEILNNGILVNKSEEWKEWTAAYLDPHFLIDYLTPKEYLEFVCKVSGRPLSSTLPPEEGKGVDTCRGFITEDLMNETKFIRNLSAGQQQKVGILATLISKPKLLILDEPFNFLDPTSQIALCRLLKQYNEETGATIIVSSHNLQHTISLCPRILLMDHGHIIRDISNQDTEAVKELEEFFIEQ